MTKKLLLSLILLIAFFLTACGENDQEHDNHDNLITHALGTAESDNGDYIITAVHDPSVPATGNNSLTLTIVDDGEPAIGLTVTLTPWMPGHGHGSNSTPTIEEIEDGVYLATDVVYTMPGVWQARIDIDSDTGSDTVVFEYDVQ